MFREFFRVGYAMLLPRRGAASIFAMFDSIESATGIRWAGLENHPDLAPKQARSHAILTLRQFDGEW
jgi:hypothetical protein